MEERRLLVALALSILVMTAWSHYFGAKGPAPRPSPAPVSQTAAEPSPAPSPQDPTSSGLAAPEKIAVAASPAVAAEVEARVEAITPAATLAFTNRGARLLSWRLARYPDARGRGEEMVRPDPDRNGVRPLDLETGDADVDARLREALFRPSAETVTVSRDGEGELVFDWSAGGIEAEKRLRFLPGESWCRSRPPSSATVGRSR